MIYGGDEGKRWLGSPLPFFGEERTLQLLAGWEGAGAE